MSFFSFASGIFHSVTTLNQTFQVFFPPPRSYRQVSSPSTPGAGELGEPQAIGGSFVDLTRLRTGLQTRRGTRTHGSPAAGEGLLLPDQCAFSLTSLSSCY